MSMWTRSGTRSSAAATRSRVGQHLEEVAAGGEQDVELARVPAASSISRRRQARRAAGPRSPSAPRARRRSRASTGGAAGKRGRVAAHLGAALDARVAADRHQPAALAADEAARQRQVDDRAHVVLAALVLRDAHAPDEHRALGLARASARSSSISSRGRPAAASSVLPARAAPASRAARRSRSVCSSTKRSSIQPLLDQVLQRADEEGDVAADVDLEERGRRSWCRTGRSRASRGSSSAPCPGSR